MKTIAAGLLVGLITLSASAADKQPLYVRYNTGETVGDQLHYRVMEEIRKSSLFELVEHDAAKFQFVLVTKDEDSHNMTSYAASLQYEDPWTFHWVAGPLLVGMCGRDRLAGCASQIITSIAQNLEQALTARNDDKKERPGPTPAN